MQQSQARNEEQQATGQQRPSPGLTSLNMRFANLNMRTPVLKDPSFRPGREVANLTPVPEESSVLPLTTEAPRKRRRLLFDEEVKAEAESSLVPPSASEESGTLEDKDFSFAQAQVAPELRAFLRGQEEQQLGPGGMLAWELQRRPEHAHT